MSLRPKRAQRTSQDEWPGAAQPKQARSSSGNSQQRSRNGSNSDELGLDHNRDHEFTVIGVGEVLELDPRPTFVLALDADFDSTWEPIYINASLRSDRQILKLLPFKAKLATPGLCSKIHGTEFGNWIKDVANAEGTRNSSTVHYSNIIWTGFSIRNRWVVISGDQCTTPPEPSPSRNEHPVNSLSEQRSEVYKDSHPRPKRALTNSGSDDESSLLDQTQNLTPAFVSPGTPDWTVAHPQGELSSHIILARSIDWAATPLGDMSTWSREFRQIACLLMANPHPAALFWGDELTVMYNKAYADTVAGLKHPRLMGTGFRGPFAEIWDNVGTFFNECRRTGKSVGVSNQMLPIERWGFTEETFYTWSLTPLYGGTDHLLGLYNAPFETTRQTRSARALATLLRLGQETALAKSVSTFWPKILKGLEDNIFDFPFAILYSVADDFEADEISSVTSVTSCSENSQSFRCCVLEGALGVPEGHAAAPARLDLKRSRGGFAPSFREALKSREPKLLSIKDGTLSESMIDGFRLRGFGEPTREAIVCPIRPTTGEIVLGFLVVGINPRRQFDEDYESFIQLLDRQLATSLASVSLLESEIRRGLTAAEAAALERSRLSEELAVQRSRLQRIAEVSPVGMFSLDLEGGLLEANETYFEMTGHSRDSIYPMSWLEVIHENSMVTVQSGWNRLTVGNLPWSSELQLRKPWYDPITGEEVDNWIIAAIQPEFWEGNLRSLMGSITDITLQKRSAKDAETRAMLSEQLLLRTQEAKENEKNFKRFSDLAPGGLVILDPLAKVLYANSQWFTISGRQQNSTRENQPYSWINSILQDDQAFSASKWDEMVSQKVTITFEVRMQTPWEGDIGGSSVTIPRWVLASMYPEISEEGRLITVMGCITDISRIKWAENLQTRRLQEAEETRRAQNNFIDITSHEMRNPLSAILQCADSIATSLAEFISNVTPDPALHAILKESISSAETIQLCAQHQKSIVDDILTISKLDSNLLVIAPVPVQPLETVRQALQMFMVECQKVHDIKMEFRIGTSFEDLKIDMVMLDSSRLLQVLINLLTNAIKFTKSSSNRTINVSIGAYLEPPAASANPTFEYFPTKKARTDVTASSDWGTGEIIYLRFEVQDSGCGLTTEEKKKLFNRFSQASPRTHVQYGGSGLGLFISRQLTELQGGEIGVASEAGVGSTFAFYVKSRRAEGPQDSSAISRRLNSEVHSNARLTTHTLKSEKDREANVSTLQQMNRIGGSSSQAHSSNSDPKAWHILIVEDNLVNQRILAQQIRKLGSTVYVANHGQEALDLIKETNHFQGKEADGLELSMVLMDLEMPIMDGLTCVRKIREMEAEDLIHGHLPIIAVTANARGEQIATAKDSGMDDVMPKPFRILQIRTKIEALLNRLQLTT